jgi:hypothetical protein
LEYEDEKKLVQTLESFCELASSDGEFLLGFGCNSHPSDNVLGEEVSSWDSACSLTSLLLEYSLRDDPCLGEPARSSFIILIELASKYPEFEKCFSNNTGLELTVCCTNELNIKMAIILFFSDSECGDKRFIGLFCSASHLLLWNK